MISFLSAQIQERRKFNSEQLMQNLRFPTEIENELLSKEQQLLFGITILNRRHSLLREEGYSYYLRELLKVTGYTGDQAKAVLEKYKNNPDKYLAVLEEIRQNLVGTYE